MPALIIPALIILIFALFIILMIGFFSARGMFKLIKTIQEASGLSSLPRSITKSLKESRYYGQLIMRTVQQYPPGPIRDRLHQTLKPVDDWLANLNRLEQGLAKIYRQRNLKREVRQTDFEIDVLRRELLTASPAEATSLRELMASKKTHLAALKELEAFQTQAELKIRKISSDLGATHAEMLLIVARGDFNHNRFHRLDENLQEHLGSLRDMLAAMDELGYTRAVS